MTVEMCEVEGCGQVATHLLFWREEYRCLDHYNAHYSEDWRPCPACGRYVSGSSPCAEPCEGRA